MLVFWALTFQAYIKNFAYNNVPKKGSGRHITRAKLSWILIQEDLHS